MYKKHLFLLNILLLSGTVCFSMMRSREIRDMGTYDQSLAHEPPAQRRRLALFDLRLAPIDRRRQKRRVVLPHFSELFHQYAFPNSDGLNEIPLDEEDEGEQEEAAPLTREFLERELAKCMNSNTRVLDLSKYVIGPLEMPLLDGFCNTISENPISGLKITFKTKYILDSKLLTEKLNLVLSVLAKNQRRGSTLHTLEIQNFHKTMPRKGYVCNNILEFDTMPLRNFHDLRMLKIGLNKNMDPSFLEHLRQVEWGEIVAPRNGANIQNAIHRFLGTAKNIDVFRWHNCTLRSLGRHKDAVIEPSNLKILVLINACRLQIVRMIKRFTFFGRRDKSGWPCLEKIYFDGCKHKNSRASIEKLTPQVLQEAKNRGIFCDVRVFYKDATDIEFREIISTSN